MDRDKGGLVALTGVAFLVLVVLGLAIGGEPPGADDGAGEIVDFYVDNKDGLRVAVFIHTAAIALLVFFAAFLRDVLQAGDGERDFLPTVAFAGILILATGMAIDTTLALRSRRPRRTSTRQLARR